MSDLATQPANSPTVPTTMRASGRDVYGDHSVVTTRTVEVPTPAPHQVLIRVDAAGLDRGVVHILTGLPLLARLMFGLRRPKQPTLGMDVAGTVVAVGGEVTDFLVGDEVMGAADGSFAEYALASPGSLVRRPANVSVEQAATATISGITALQAVVDIGKVQAGQKVLVTGASGGVGSFAVQIAAALGAEVTGVASARNLDAVRRLGATDAVDYRRDDLSGHAGRYDLIIDIAGRRPVRQMRHLLTPTGTFVIVGGEDGGKVTGGLGRQLRTVLWSPFVRQRMTFFVSTVKRDLVERLAAMLADGTITSAVTGSVDLDGVAGAIEWLEAGKSSGKTVIVVGVEA